ncbi:MAG: right-handed parallel beta-helix repeat-containing protein [Planctomycetia bacterium]|nr:right-handed parallel beta-helix repeat-containing protein [Planctomycetia bacterium]
MFTALMTFLLFIPGEIPSLDEVLAEAKKKPLRQGDEIIYQLPPGNVLLKKTWELGSSDSGKRGAKIVFQGDPKNKTRLLCGHILKNWKPVTDINILSKIPKSAHGKIYFINLKELGISNFGSPLGEGAELFFNDTPMTLARYPNNDFLKISRVGSNSVCIFCDDDRFLKWKTESAPCVSGYWFYDWSQQAHEVEMINTEKKCFSIKPPYHGYGYRAGQWFYGFNLLGELDAPNEYYLDRTSGNLYFYPPENIRSVKDLSKYESLLTSLHTAIQARHASWITFRNLILEGTQKKCIIIRDGENVVFEDCVIKNSGDGGLQISGGKNHVVHNCVFYGLGAYGIHITGGNRKMLQAANHRVDNNYIHHYARIKKMYQPGISISGVGNVVSHNLISDAPHMAINFQGNDHILEYNEITRVCQESHDAGAIYAGRNCTMRGNIIRFNFLHDINGFLGKGCVGIYLDDMFSSAEIHGNIFLRVSRAAMIGGGRDNRITNNIFIDCIPSLHVDARGLKSHANKKWLEDWRKELNEKGTISGIAYNKPPFSERYPELAKITEKNLTSPEGNEISRNICYRGVWDQPAGFWKASVSSQARPFLKMEKNITWTKKYSNGQFIGDWMGENPLFKNSEDPQKAEFQLMPESPALKNGFKQIPYKKMGRQKE